jgi:hypothetical protein
LEPGKSIDFDTAIEKKQDIISSGMDDETVMMSIENGEYYGLNPVGGRIWELLDRPRTAAGICDILVEEYDVPVEECQREVKEFVEKLLEKKLVKITGG